MPRIRTSYKIQDEIPEPYRDLFTEQADDTWTLTEVEGIKLPGDVERLDKALRKEREAHKETKKKILAFGEFTPEKMVELTDQVEELRIQLEAGGNKPDEKALEALVERRAEAKKRPLERDLKTAQEELSTLRTTNETLSKADQRRRRNDALRQVTTGDKGVKLRAPSVLEDIELYAERVLEENESGEFVTRDGVGVTPGLPPLELLREVYSSGRRPHWFPENEGAGAEGSRKPGGGGDDPFTAASADGKRPAQVNMNVFQRLILSDSKRAEMLAKKHGRTDLVSLVQSMKPRAA